jgi:crossover junction endodeoxyribonuclease RusA
MTYTLTLVRPGPLLNMNDRGHWRTKAANVKVWRTAAFYATKAAGIPRLGRTLVKVTLPIRTPNTRRDPSNWYPTIKVLVDGITDAGVWPDDHAGWVVTQEPTFTTGTTVTIELFPA